METKYTPFNRPVLIVAATENPHKLDEIRAILGPSGIEVAGLDRYPSAPAVEEDRPTLKGNAARKSETLFAFTGLPTVADDTGLEVAALGGDPGVRSARYAGEDADDERNRKKLLRELDNRPDRTARFRTVIAFTTAAGTEFFEGVCDGVIAEEPRGDGGFGYDPIFLPDGAATTFAEMEPEHKNRISHRARALARFAEHLGVTIEQASEAGG